MTAWYNENDPQAANWLEELIHERLIAPGVVDRRSIRDVRAEDLRGFVQCHFFAGIGVWSYALRQAGWADDEPVWTGSCPCQPFSGAGRQTGFNDPRHLWPDWLRLIDDARQDPGVYGPHVILGEQVADANAWLDLVSSDLEARGFAFGAADLAAAGFTAAHRRQRFWWVADANNAEWWAANAPGHDGDGPQTGRIQGDGHFGNGGPDVGVGDAHNQRAGRDARAVPGQEGGLGGRLWGLGDGADDAGSDGRLGDADQARLSDAQFGFIRRPGRRPEGRAVEQPSHPSGAGVDWLLCRDSRWRPVESGSSPLVDEAPARMVRLRGYGNALDAETATAFIAAYRDALAFGRAAA